MMTDKNYRLSIIIPSYNVENYIEETLSSCLEQDIPESDYEIICIDDGSKDNTVEKIEKFVHKHSNVKLFTQENSGVSATRNRGIDLAQGNYIWFVDSDDIIAENCLKLLLDNAEKYDTDKLLFGMRHFSSVPTHDKTNHHFEFCSGNEKLFNFTLSHGGGGVWRSLYKTKLIKLYSIKFNEELAFSEDILFDFRFLINAEKCLKTDNVYYFYRQRTGSAIHSDNFNKHIPSMYLLATEYKNISKSSIPQRWQKISVKKSWFATKALLFSLVRSADITKAKEYLTILNRENLYPYPFLNILFNNKSFREFIISWVSFLFPLKWYFLFCVRLMSFKNKIFKK